MKRMNYVAPQIVEVEMDTEDMVAQSVIRVSESEGSTEWVKEDRSWPAARDLWEE